MAIPRWYRTKEIAPHTWAIDDHGQDVMYLLYGTERALLMDTGFGIGDLAALARELMGQNLPLIVVNTHVHPDHAGGNYQFQRVYVGEGDVPSASRSAFGERREGMLERMRQVDAEALAEAWPHGMPSRWGEPAAEIIPVHEGHVFDLGGRSLEAISIPGHTPGSTCLLDRAARLLFVGDSVHNRDLWMHIASATPLRTLLRSLHHLQQWDSTYDRIFWGHSMEPLPPSTLPTLISAVEAILEGRAVGQPFQTFAGDGLRYDYGAGAIIYRADRLG